MISASRRKVVLIFRNQMHLGYHELRKMLQQFREDRDKRKMAPPPTGGPPSAGVPPSPGGPRGAERGGDYRSSSRDDYRERDRERDRGYDRDRYPRHE